MHRPFDPNCSGRVVLDHVTSKWGVLVLLALDGRTLRWGELCRTVEGISEKLLAQTLRTLEGDGGPVLATRGPRVTQWKSDTLDSASALERSSSRGIRISPRSAEVMPRADPEVGGAGCPRTLGTHRVHVGRPVARRRVAATSAASGARLRSPSWSAPAADGDEDRQGDAQRVVQTAVPPPEGRCGIDLAGEIGGDATHTSHQQRCGHDRCHRMAAVGEPTGAPAGRARSCAR